jgi:hypothetical protein
MQPKDNYIIWREMNGIFTALNKDKKLQAWVIGTGKTTKPIVSLKQIELQGFKLYACNENDDSYKRNWQQHPEHSIALLKATHPLEYYQAEQVSILTEN